MPPPFTIHTHTDPLHVCKNNGEQTASFGFKLISKLPPFLPHSPPSHHPPTPFKIYCLIKSYASRRHSDCCGFQWIKSRPPSVSGRGRNVDLWEWLHLSQRITIRLHPLAMYLPVRRISAKKRRKEKRPLSNYQLRNGAAGRGPRWERRRRLPRAGDLRCLSPSFLPSQLEGRGFWVAVGRWHQQMHAQIAAP